MNPGKSNLLKPGQKEKPLGKGGQTREVLKELPTNIEQEQDKATFTGRQSILLVDRQSAFSVYFQDVFYNLG